MTAGLALVLVGAAAMGVACAFLDAHPVFRVLMLLVGVTVLTWIGTALISEAATS